MAESLHSLEAKINRKINRLTGGSSKKDAGTGGAAPPVLTNKPTLQVVGPWVHAAGSSKAPPLPGREGRKSVPSIPRTSSPAADTVESVRQCRQDEQDRLGAAQRRKAALEEWACALDAHAATVAAGIETRDQELAALQAAVARERAEVARSSEADEAADVATDAEADLGDKNALDGLKLAAERLRDRALNAEAAAEVHQKAVAEAERVHAAAIERLAADDADALRLGDAPPSAEGLAKGAMVFAKRRAEDADWLEARIEAPLSTGKYLVMFDESTKVRAVCDVSLLRRTRPQQRSDVEREAAAARDAAVAAHRASLLALGEPTDDVASIRAEADAAESAFKRKAALMDVKRKKQQDARREAKAARAQTRLDNERDLDARLESGTKAIVDGWCKRQSEMELALGVAVRDWARVAGFSDESVSAARVTAECAAAQQQILQHSAQVALLDAKLEQLEAAEQRRAQEAAAEAAAMAERDAAAAAAKAASDAAAAAAVSVPPAKLPERPPERPPLPSKGSGKRPSQASALSSSPRGSGDPPKAPESVIAGDVSSPRASSPRSSSPRVSSPRAAAPEPTGSAITVDDHDAADDQMDEFDARIAQFESMLDHAQSAQPGSDALLREKEAQIQLLAAQVAQLKDAMAAMKRDPDKGGTRSRSETADWQAARVVAETYEHLLDDELPELPNPMPPISDTIRYKNYMRLRYEHQRRGLLEGDKPASPRKEAVAVSVAPLLPAKQGARYGATVPLPSSPRGGNASASTLSASQGRNPLTASSDGGGRAALVSPGRQPASRDADAAMTSRKQSSGTSPRGESGAKAYREDFDPSGDAAPSQRPARAAPPVPRFAKHDFVEALLLDDGFFYLAQIREVDGDRYVVHFVEYGCFGTEQDCDVTQMRPLKAQPRFGLGDSCLVAPVEGSRGVALEVAVVEKIGLGATRTACAYHVRVQHTGKVRSCVEAEMQPNPDAAPKKKKATPAVDELDAGRMSVMLQDLDWEFTRFFDELPAHKTEK